TLRESAERFAASAAARELFGNTFVDHFAATRRWESERHERFVDDWQLARYFEII
ncbi:MAG: glutamine synthetase, partial [Gammaproteobacteria bacterium]|nr:glutamine synthetase [Gammaproteobacteria bacterium]